MPRAAPSRLRALVSRGRVFVAGCALEAAAVALLVYFGGPPGVDMPAHLFGTWAYQHFGFEIWNNYWYAGRYEFVNYSLLYYPLAASIGQAAATAASAAVLGGSFASACRSTWGRAALGPSVGFAVTAPLVLMISGAYPFLAGAAAAAGALALLARGSRAGVAVAVVAAFGFSPLAFALLLALLAGLLLGQPRPGRTLRRERGIFAAVVVVFIAGVFLERAFPTSGQYPYDVTDAAIVLAFSLAGLYVTGKSPHARSLRMVFAVYLAVNLIAFLLPGPIGSNATRLFAIGGAPLLWLAANLGSRSQRLVLPVLATALALQLGPFVRDSYSSWHDAAAAPSFWRPAVAFLRAHPDPQHRVEVVATWGHWEAYYLAKRGVPLARGWFRQDDFPQNRALYADPLTPRLYRRWLRRMAIRYVLLGNTPLDYSAVSEAALLRSGHSGLAVVARRGAWTVYRLRHTRPLVTPPAGARASVVNLGQGRVNVWASAPGRYLVRVRYSPYWEATPASACVAPAAGGWTAVTTPAAGDVDLAIAPALGDVAGTLAQAPPDC